MFILMDETLLQASEISSARKSVTSQLSCDTYRSSWASFDLLNSVNDPLMLPLLNNMSHSTVDQMNERKRREGRQVIIYVGLNLIFCFFTTVSIVR